MQCEFCDNKATVFFTQILDGVTKKTCLCDNCATERGVTDPEGFLLGKTDFPSSPQPEEKDSPASEPQHPTPDATACCPGCGFAFDDLKKTGRLGCSECYSFFRAEINHNLTGMHKGTKHTGRIPEGMMEAFQKRQELEKLHAEMHTAIQNEDYEKAAQLRDQINQLEDPTSLATDSSEQNSDNVGS